MAKHKVEGIKQALKEFSYPALQYKEPGQIYLAGPFFSYTQRWLIGEFYQALKSEGVMLFSPLHDQSVLYHASNLTQNVNFTMTEYNKTCPVVYNRICKKPKGVHAYV